jgi:nicotinate-nucleotide adenylyltransferase
VPPHKPLPHRITDAARLAMLRLALADDPSFRVCPVEFALPPPSYTLRTVETLQTLYPSTQFVFIVGADSLQQLHTWHRPMDLLARIPFLPLARPGFTLTPADIHLPPPWPARLLDSLQTASLVPAASSAIRAELAATRTSPLVPPAVLRYIHDHSLYQEHDP